MTALNENLSLNIQHILTILFRDTQVSLFTAVAVKYSFFENFG